MNWLSKSIIFETVHGSKAYGLNTESSDLDLKGICIPPLEIATDLFHKFHQCENNEEFHTKHANISNPNNPKIESVIYSLEKFFVLAAQVNPSIIELLWVDPVDILFASKEMDIILDNRDLFLSSKLKYSFGGYAVSQLSKIERHRKWIVKGDIKKPERKDFGLSESRTKYSDEVFSYIKSKVENWNLSKYPMEQFLIDDLKENIWDLISSVSSIKVGWDNWPEAYQYANIDKLGKELNLKDEIIDVLHKETTYKKAVASYNSWTIWKKTRNPERAKLEQKCGYDSKCALHLVRLLRMAVEALETGKIIVKRPDREELLFIKNGGWTYDQIMEYANSMQEKLNELYKTTKIPKSVNYEKINDLYQSIIEKYYQKL